MKLPKTKKEWSILIGAVIIIVVAVVKFAGCELDLNFLQDAADVLDDAVDVEHKDSSIADSVTMDAAKPLALDASIDKM